MRWARRIFMRSAGMLHTALSKSSSALVAQRNFSPGRHASMASNCSAAFVVGWPLKPSMARNKPPNASGSVIAARDFTFGATMAPFNACVGSFGARAVTTARRNTAPMTDRSRLAVFQLALGFERLKHAQDFPRR